MSERADPFADEPIGNVVDAGMLAPDASTDALQNSPRQKTTKPWIWLMLFCLGLFVIDFLAIPVLERAFGGLFQMWPNYLLVSWFYSQAFLGIILSAVIGRVWLTGIAVGTIFVAVSISMVILSQELGVGTSFFIGPMDKSIAWTVCSLPALLMICGSPLLLMRWLRGWRLTLTQPITARGAFGIEELLLSTASIAALFAISQLTAAGYEVPVSTLLTSFVFAGGIAALFTLFIGIPLVWSVFRLRSFWAKLGITIVLGFFMATAIFLIGMISGSRDAIALILIVVSLMLCVVLFFLLFIQRIGFRIAHYAPRAADTMAFASKPHDKIFNRYATAIAVSCAILCAGTSSYLEGNLRWREAKYEIINSQFEELGGEIELRDGKLHKVVLGPTQSMIDLMELPTYANIRSLKLRGEAYNDQSLSLLPALRELEELDLSGTVISDASFEVLKQCSKLTSLNLARTKITIPGLMTFLRVKPNINRLDISGLNITDNEIQTNDRLANIHELVLRDNKITEIGATKLLTRQSDYGSTLDLSNNPIDFSNVKITGMLSSLTLEDLSIDDKQFANLFLNGQTPVTSLTIANTKLTNASLTQLMTLLSINQLTVGDGNFTDDGFAKISLPLSLSNLHIKGKQFTGSFLESWVPQYMNTLSFAHSAVQGSYLKHLVKPDHSIYHLDLSHCPQLSDADLLLLKGATISSLSIIETPFTCDGLLKLELANQACEIYTALGQFTGDEISLLRRKYTVHVGEKPQYGY